MEPATDIARRLVPTIRGIIAAIGIPASRIPSLAQVLGLVYRRIFALIGRLDRLMVKFNAGTLPKPRHRASRPPASARPDSASKPALRIPAAQGWIFRVAQPAAQWRPHVERFVNDPDIIALAAAAPQAGRLLRPLCRLMLVPIPEQLRLPPRPPRAHPMPPRPKSQRPLQPAAPVAPMPAPPAPWDLAPPESSVLGLSVLGLRFWPN